ncbi:MAG: restriction endonuclease subunit S [Betaproteobacteria bacterium]|nr:restriction endonuclease subunit S [Betaproteobacteria bacterium]
MNGWRREPFDSVIADESGGNLKTPQSEFLLSGRYAIVDQGKELIAGYTNDESRLCRAQLPVIVFGDHTRCFKYVDFPFCMGADGVKVLRPKVEAEVKYLYHYLRQVRLTEGGYDRHFKYLKRASVALPPLPEQRRIAEILDKADALRANRRAALAQLDTLTQSIFLDMFGDPATNPKGWKKTSLEELFEIARGGSPRPIDDYITDAPDGINWIMIGDTVEGGKYITVTKKRIRPEGARRSRAVKPGDFLLTNSMSFGRPYILRTTGCIHDGWLVLSPRSEEAEPNYFYALLGSKAVYAEFARRAPGATVKNLNIDLVRDVIVPVPPLPAQRKFAALVATIERSTSTFSNALVELDALFSSLQHRAFQGNL